MRYSFAPFLVLAIAFLAIGVSGQRSFIYIGIVFLVLGLVMAKKTKQR